MDNIKIRKSDFIEPIMLKSLVYYMYYMISKVSYRRIAHEI